MFKYAYNSLVYYGEDVDTSVKRVARFGYDALELYGEPQEYDTAHVRELCKDHGITISSICSIYTDERDLASPDEKIRHAGIDYMKRVADLAAETGCPVMIVAPTACMKMDRWKNPDEEWKWAVESIQRGGEYAGSVKVNLTIEAWNRYETYFLNRLEQYAACSPWPGSPGSSSVRHALAHLTAPSGQNDQDPHQRPNSPSPH